VISNTPVFPQTLAAEALLAKGQFLFKEQTLNITMLIILM
jgi:hypothetical protein